MPKINKQSFGELSRAIVALQLTLFLLPIVYADVGLNLKHNANKNVNRNTYVKDQKVIVKFEHDASAEGSVTYHWQDYKGEKLSEPAPLDAGKETIFTAPAGELPRYLGLVFTPVTDTVRLPGREPGESKEYGFAIFTDGSPKTVQPDANRWMGMVHADRDDPWLFGWVKTLTWKTTSSRWWRSTLDKRRDAGSVELPIIYGSEWKSDDYEPVGPDQLKRLEKRARDYFAADQGTVYWETGIEENLGGRFKRPYYLANLAAKSDVVRAAADDVNPDIKLIFQIANMNYKHVGDFMESDAARNYDILSLHPYNWPDFPPTEEWLTNFLEQVRGQMKESGRNLPIWVTEIGAPHRGNCPDCFFGYPKDNKSVPGLSNQEMITYMIKFHVIAVHDGVEKVFWYNYKDRDAARDFAEDHFGLIDYWGYPKPAYPAYIHLNRTLADKAVGRVLRDKHIWAYEFRGDREDVIVAWSFPADSTEVSLAELGISLSSDTGIRITDAIGDAVELKDCMVSLTQEPVFIHLSRGPEGD